MSLPLKGREWNCNFARICLLPNIIDLVLPGLRPLTQGEAPTHEIRPDHNTRNYYPANHVTLTLKMQERGNLLYNQIWEDLNIKPFASSLIVTHLDVMFHYACFGCAIFTFIWVLLEALGTFLSFYFCPMQASPVTWKPKYSYVPPLPPTPPGLWESPIPLLKTVSHISNWPFHTSRKMQKAPSCSRKKVSNHVSRQNATAKSYWKGKKI